MLTDRRKSRSSRLALWVGLAGVGVGIVAGLLAGTKPVYLFLAPVAIAVVIYFFARFEQAVLNLLIVRSFIDCVLPLPSVYAVGLNALTLLYVVVMLFTGRTVRTDGFWWLFAGWWLLQGLWVVLLPMGALGLDASYLSDSVREWVRIFSWLMVYLLVMQLQDRLPPQKVISRVLLAAVLPVAIALMQVFLPSLLPSFFSPNWGDTSGGFQSAEASRIRGTFGAPNGFATFLLLFIGLTWWKLGQTKQRWPWLILLGLLTFFFVGTKSLFSLMMLGVFVLVLIAPKLSLPHLIGGVLLFGGVIFLFGSTEFGQQRLESISNTPLLNPDIDIWRAILLSQGDNNSFNWRLSQWYLELSRWQDYPILGYGLGLSLPAAGNGYLPHNDYVRALVEGGVVGFVTFLIFLGAPVVRLVQLIRYARPESSQRKLCWILLAMALSIPVGMITENIWTHTALFMYYWSVFGVAGWDWREPPPSKNPVSASPPAQLHS